MSIESRTRAWVEIDLDALRANFQVIRQSAGAEQGVLPLVKANAYGLGMDRIVAALEPAEPWGWGVACATEGLDLRAAGVARRILVVTPIPPGEEPHVVEARLTPSVSDLGSLERLAAAARHAGTPIDFHVEIDTGMGRSGFDWRLAGTWGAAVAARAGPLRWTGAFTHFHSADEPEGREPSREQWRRFEAALAELPVARAALVVHAANSAGALRWPEPGADLVRPGIYLYGGHAAPGAADESPRLAPRPVVAIRARLSLVRDVPPGTTCGYGATYTTVGSERWATAAIGYGDGLPRSLGNRGWALVRGRRVPIRGRLSMDSLVLDVSDVPAAEAGEIATFVGEDEGERITLEEAAALAGTIGYEVLTRLGTRLPRVYLEEKGA